MTQLVQHGKRRLLLGLVIGASLLSCAGLYWRCCHKRPGSPEREGGNGHLPTLSLVARWGLATNHIAFSMDTESALIGVGNSMYLYQLGDGSSRHVGLTRDSMSIAAVAVDPEVTRALIASIGSCVVECLDLRAKRPSKRLIGHSQRVSALAFVDHGVRAISASWDGTCRLWDVETAAMISSYMVPGGSNACKLQEACILDDMVTIDMDRVLLGTENNGLWIMNFRTGECIAFSAQFPNACKVAVSPDQAYIASGGNDGRVHIWHANDAGSPVSISAHSRPVTCLLFTIDNGLVSGSGDETLRMWRPQGNEQIATLKGAIPTGVVQVKGAKHSNTFWVATEMHGIWKWCPRQKPGLSWEDTFPARKPVP